MFQPWKSDNGAVLPWEYLPAEAGTYHVGQALNLDATTGHLEAVAADLDTTPPYICNAEVKVETAGTPIPVSRTSRDVIYETTLQAAAAGTVAGSRLVVKSGGTQVGAGDGTFEVVTAGGRTPTGLDAVEWAQQGEALGAGEILLTSMDADGTKAGFDLEMTRAVTQAVSIPVIASGGGGTLEHFAQVFQETGCDAALAASLFHFGELTVPQVKDFLRGKNIPVR